MRELPISYTTEMVRAILREVDPKTQTRRVVTKQNSEIGEGGDWAKLDFTDHRSDATSRNWPSAWVDTGFPGGTQYLHVPYNFAEWGTIYRVYPRIEVGDHLWVKETYCSLCADECGVSNGVGICYRASDPEDNDCIPHWKSGRFMFKKYARIWLEVIGVRAEPLQEISNVDIQAEGVDGLHPLGGLYREQWKQRFRSLWDSINAKRGYGWDVNPWVWVYEFKRLIRIGGFDK